MWVPAHGGHIIALLRSLCDFVQVTALQTLLPARELQWFVVSGVVHAIARFVTEPVLPSTVC